MAKCCARLALFAFAAAGGAEAQDRGDAVALVQHKLESQSAPEELSADGMSTAVGAFINMLKFENLIRKSVFGEDAAATTGQVALARDVPDDAVPNFKIPESVMPKSKAQEIVAAGASGEAAVQEGAAAGESAQVEATLGSGFWNIGKGKKLSQAAMTRAGASCSSQDLVSMQKAMDAYQQIAEKEGPSHIQYAIPPVCKEAVTFGVDFNKFDACVQKTFEISPGCSKCHVDVMKGVSATDLFHPKCSIPCMKAMSNCPDQNDQVPPQKCMGSLGKCMDCFMPEVRKQAACIGGILNNEETLAALQMLAKKLSAGKMATPLEFRKAIEEVYDKAEMVE